MQRLTQLIASGLLAAALFAGGHLSVAAQPNEPCPLVSDDAVSQALGSPFHATNAKSEPPYWMCYVLTGELLDTLTIVFGRSAGVVTAGDANPAFALAQSGVSQVPGVDQSTVNFAPIGELGDSAVMITAQAYQTPLTQLVVTRGADAYTFVATPKLSDPQTNLQAMARVVLAKP